MKCAHWEETGYKAFQKEESNCSLFQKEQLDWPSLFSQQATLSDNQKFSVMCNKVLKCKEEVEKKM